jgi:hypothetical protein
MDHTTRAVLAQADVDDTTNEITQFQPLLDGVDLTGAVVTADALSRSRHKASYAEVFVMPRWGVVGAAVGVTGLVRSA